MVKALKTITWQDIIRMLNSDVYLYELGRKWGNDFLTSEQQAAMIRKYDWYFYGALRDCGTDQSRAGCQ